MRRAKSDGKKTKQTPAETSQLGESRRRKIQRRDLGTWDPKKRTVDPLHLLEASVQGRIRSLLSIRTERMLASPFGFFRGAAAIMAYDLSLSVHTGILNQICGDAHVENLGAYSGADGRLIFDINDFDETTHGPFEWDLKRMATSVLLAGKQGGLKGSEARAAAEVFLNSYCLLVSKMSHLPVLEVARFQVHRLEAAPPILKILRKAERSTPLISRYQLTEETRSGRVFRNAPPLLRRVRGEERGAVLRSLGRYRNSLLPERQHFLAQYRPIDVAFKVVGVGSVGMRDFCVYLEGNGPDDPLFLQIKEETASTYAPYLSKRSGRAARNGQRVAEGQRAMQLQSDPLLGWTSLDGPRTTWCDS